MKVIEILNFNRELLTRLLESGIRLEDVRYVNLYTDYFHLLRAGEKNDVYRGDTCRTVRYIRAQGLRIDKTFPK